MDNFMNFDISKCDPADVEQYEKLRKELDQLVESKRKQKIDLANDNEVLTKSREADKLMNKLLGLNS